MRIFLSDLRKLASTLEKDNSYLMEKIEELENRSRSHNLRFLHVPEQAEDRNVLEFMKKLIPQLLGEENFTIPPVIERAHRSPTTRRHDRAAPRPILVKFLLFQDKIKLLRHSQVKKDLLFNGVRIHIYSDYSAGVPQKRHAFNSIKKKLRELNFKYSLMFPATLKVIVNGKSRFFGSPDDVEIYFRDDMSSP